MHIRRGSFQGSACKNTFCICVSKTYSERMVVQYKAKTQNFCLPNILLDTTIIPEAVFQSCSPENLASLLKKLMLNNGCREKQIVAAELVSKLLCPCDRTMHHLPSAVAALTGLLSKFNRFNRILFPSDRIVYNLPKGSVTNLDCTPSAVAALTVLTYGRQNSVINKGKP